VGDGDPPLLRPFSRDLEHADERMRNVKGLGEPTDIPCAECAANMVIKWGRNGEFLACSRYPDARTQRTSRAMPTAP